MVTDEVQELIAVNERITTEFKSSFSWDMKKDEQADWLRDECHIAICAFLNNQGGELLIGVDDDGNVVGLDKDVKRYGNMDRLIQAIEAVFGKTLTPKPVALVTIAPVEVEGISMLRVTVLGDRTTKYQFKEQIYVRRNSGSKPPLTAAEAVEWWQRRQLVNQVVVTDEASSQSDKPPYTHISPHDLPYMTIKDPGADPQLKPLLEQGWKFVGASPNRLAEKLNDGWQHIIWKSPDGKYFRTSNSFDLSLGNVWMMRRKKDEKKD